MRRSDPPDTPMRASFGPSNTTRSTRSRERYTDAGRRRNTHNSVQTCGNTAIRRKKLTCAPNRS